MREQSGRQERSAERRVRTPLERGVGRGVGRGALVVFGATVLVACVSLQWQPIGSRRVAAIEGAEPIGSEECLVCHEDVKGHEKIQQYHRDCEACHGGGSLHADSEEAAEIRYPDSADCLVCHAAGRDTHLQWGAGQHSMAGVICSDCHDPHNIRRENLREFPQPAFRDMDSTSQLCIECHRDVGTRFHYPTHHPVAEGAMGCISCHNPHEDARVAHGDRNQRCAGCHQDIMGPWIYEHPPAVEDCTICHNPHGAVTTDLLETVQPVICLQCHTLNDEFHQRSRGTGIPTNATIDQDFPTDPDQLYKPIQPGDVDQAGTFLRRCTDCHGAVHGSYTDEHLRH